MSLLFYLVIAYFTFIQTKEHLLKKYTIFASYLG